MCLTFMQFTGCHQPVQGFYWPETCVMRNARAHKIQWSGSTVHSFTVVLLFVAKHCFTEGMIHDIVVKFQSFVIYRCRKMYTLIIHLSDVSTKYYSVLYSSLQMKILFFQLNTSILQVMFNLQNNLHMYFAAG